MLKRLRLLLAFVDRSFFLVAFRLPELLSRVTTLASRLLVSIVGSTKVSLITVVMDL